MNTAIIAAAGSGSRFGAERPKQFLPLLGKPVLLHTVERFILSPVISSVVVVLAEEEIDGFGQILKNKWPDKMPELVAGGVTRSESVANGFAACPSLTKIVVVHDGVRPLVSEDEIERTIRAAEEAGAACLVAPVTDTIKEVDGDLVVGTIDRRKLRRALTPQAFRYEVFREAILNTDLHDGVTDECFMVERLGQTIVTVPGNSQNIKITLPEDLLFAEALLAAGKCDQ